MVEIKSEACSPYIEQKWLLFYNFLDTDGDGKLTFHDFDVLARNFKNSRTLTAANAARMHHLWLRWWTVMEQLLGEPVLEMPEEMYLVAMRSLASSARQRFEFEDIWEHMFDVIDQNKNGEVSEDELSAFYRWHGVKSEIYAQEVFTNLDIDQDGVISRDEFRHAILAYWFGDDPNSDYSFMFSNRPTRQRKRQNKARQRTISQPAVEAKRWALCCWL